MQGDRAVNADRGIPQQKRGYAAKAALQPESLIFRHYFFNRKWPEGVFNAVQSRISDGVEFTKGKQKCKLHAPAYVASKFSAIHIIQTIYHENGREYICSSAILWVILYFYESRQ